MLPFNIPFRMRWAVLAVAAATGAGAGLVSVAHAQTSITREVRLPAQDLGGALDSLAAQAGIRLLYSPEAVKGRRAPALEGQLDVGEALSRLLAGSGLEWSMSGGAYAIKQGSAAAPAGIKDLAPVTITATRTERNIEDVPASVTIVGLGDIRTQQPRTTNDLLRNVEGIDLVTSQPLAGLEAVTIRGVGTSFGGSLSPILIDGLSLESPVAGVHVGMKAIALQDIERIEIVRGPTSALYGPNAVGGVVNLIPKRWQGAPGGELEVGFGSHDARRVTTAIGTESKTVDIRFSAHDYRTGGFAAQPEPNRWGGKDWGPRNAEERKFGLVAGLRPSYRQEVTLAYRHGGVDSSWLGGHPNYRIEAKAESVDFGYRHEVGAFAVLKARYRKIRQKARLLLDSDSWGAVGDPALAEVDDRVDVSDIVDLQADVALGEAHLLSVGYSLTQSKYSTWSDYPLLGNSERTHSKSRLTGFFIQDEHRFSNGLTALVGARLDRYKLFGDTYDGVATAEDSNDSVLNPRLGLRYRITPVASLYASVGSAYVPATHSLKFRGDQDWIDNPALKPETSTSYELGGNYRKGPVKARAAIYHTDYEDKIERITVGAKYQFANVAKVAIDGLELAAEWNLAGGWRPYANYTYTDSRVRMSPGEPATEGKRLAYTPPHKANLGVLYAPSDDFYARLSGRYKSAHYFDDNNTPAAYHGGYYVADVKFGWKLPAGGFARRLELTFAVNNLFDRNFRETQYEYQDGLNVWLGLNARF